MSLRKTLATVLVFATLQLVGAFVGFRMTSEDIEKLMNALHRTKVEHVIKKKDPP